MACFKTTLGRWIPENSSWSKLPGEAIVPGVIDWRCGKQLPGDFKYTDEVVTSDGLMVGNLMKKVATTIGLHHCLKCSKRQRRFNEMGLKVQRRLGLIK